MELECDISNIKSEELLRKMWQQSEDIQRKKEIRSHLYKLRESRLRDLYQSDIMADQAFSKDPLTTSHGDSLADQSFQSLKSKEIRDSMSPTHDVKFHALALNQPNTTGWNVQASTEVSPDGRAYRTETLATTDGIEKLNGGVAEFKGRNEQRSSASHQGDDKNFVKKAAESSNTHLQEHVVLGDENSGRIEKKVSSTTSSSTSEFVSSSTTGFDELAPGERLYLTDSHLHKQHEQQRLQQQHHHQQQRLQQQQREAAEAQHMQGRRVTEQNATELRQQERQERYTEHKQKEETSTKVETAEQHEQTKRYVDMDKASPEYQQHVQYLMAQPGEIISNTVEYPKPNVKMITTVKRLPDGTIVRNKRYETEEVNQPVADTRRSSSTQQQTRNTQQQRTERREDNLQTRLKQSREQDELRQRTTSPQKKPSDEVDNVEHVRELSKQYADEVSHSYSSVQKSSRRFSTETTSETVEEYNDRTGRIPKSQDFTTHGFPSVKPNKPTQEFPNERPYGSHPSDGFSTTLGFPSVKPGIPTQEYPSEVLRQHPNNATPNVVKTVGPDGEIIVTVSKESVRNVKQKSSSEHVEIHERTDGAPSLRKPTDFSTHGFPSVRDSSPLIEMPTTPQQSSPMRRSKSPDFSTHGFPSVRSPTKTPTGVRPSTADGELIQVSTEKMQKSSYKTNAEHIVETKRAGDDFVTVREGTPTREYPARTNQTPRDDYSTNGFPSVRSPTKSKPDYSTHGFPSVRETSKTDGRTPSSPSRTHPTTPTQATTKKTTTNNTATETTQRFVQKEKETDAAHRAFAASLRSASPIEPPHRRDTPDHTRQTPRSSISSTKTFRRDAREGSHDSNAASETSRISSNTVTRPSPGKQTTGKTVITKQTVTKTRQANGSNETIDLLPVQRSTKSPSPAKSTVSTTTKTTSNATTTKPQRTSDAPSTTITTTTTSTTSNKPDKAAKHTTKSSLHSSNADANNNSHAQRAPKHVTYAIDTKAEAVPGTLHERSSSPFTPRTSAPSNASNPNKARSPLTRANVPYHPNEPLNNTMPAPDTVPTHYDDHLRIHEDQATIESETIVSNIDKWLETNEINTNTSKPRPQPNNSKPQPTRRSQSPEQKPRKFITEAETTVTTVEELTEVNENDVTRPRQQPNTADKHPSTRRPQSPEQKPRSRPFKGTESTITTAEEFGDVNETQIIKEKQQPSKPRQQPNRRSESPQHKASKTTIESETFVTESGEFIEINESDTTGRPKLDQNKPRQQPTRRSQSPEQKPRRPSKTTESTVTNVEDFIEVNETEILNEKQQPKKPRQQPNRRSQSPEQKPRRPSKTTESTVTNIEDFIEVNETEVLNEKQQPNKPRQQPNRRSQSPEQKPQRPSKTTESTVTKIEDFIEVNETEILNEKQQPNKPRQQPNRRSQSPEQKPRKTTVENETILTEVDELLEVCEIDKGKKQPNKPTQQPNRRTQSPEQSARRSTIETETTKQTSYNPKRTPDNYTDTERVDELFTSTKTVKQTKKNTKNINEEFIQREGRGPSPAKEPLSDNEAPDGSFFSKQPGEERQPTPTSPTYRKKGLSRRETFEERCRVILGMENEGDTQGVYKPKPETEPIEPAETKPKQNAPLKNGLDHSDEPKTENPETPTKKKPEAIRQTTFEVSIEDCDDDEPLSITNVRTSLKVQQEKAVKTEKTSTKETKKQPEVQPIKKEPKQQKSTSPARDTKPTPHQKASSPVRDIKAQPQETTTYVTETTTTTTTKRKPFSSVPESEPENLWEVPTKPATTRKTLTETTEDFIAREKTIRATTDDEEHTLIIEEAEPKQPKGRKPAEKTKPEQFVVEETEIITRETKPSKSPHSGPKPQTDTITIEDCFDDIEEEQTFKSERFTSTEEKLKTKTVRGRTNSPSSKDSSPERGSARSIPDEETTPEEPLTNGKGPRAPKETSSFKKPSRKQVEPLVDAKTPTKKRPSLSKTTPQEPLVESQKSTTTVTKKSSSTTTTAKQNVPLIKKSTNAPTTNGDNSPTTTRPSRKSTTTTTSEDGTSIKDRLRSSPRKHKPKSDDIDGHTTTTSSSTETSPIRYDSERRRSSNISVHTEIIIDHVAPKSPKASPKVTPTASPEKELPVQKPLRQRMPVTERKESAPVQRVTRREKEMMRSTSENVMKVTSKSAPQEEILRPTTPTKHDKRPNKCFTTKTINLTTKDHTLRTDDRENIIIDIQHAKSSREPSPDKIVPTPVPAHLDTGKPRYPDVVQEPEDEPHKQTVIKNIPIFEEETNEYVKCHITEINVNGRRDLHELPEAEEILVNPTIEAPVSLEFDKPDDESLLTVTEKVAKFAHTAEEVSKPKASSPFNREFDESTRVPENDECLLTINQKVDKFLKDAESITKHKVTVTRSIDRPNYEELDEELRKDDCTLSVSQKVNKFLDTAEKLAPTAPQKSPRLVASIERSISKQDEKLTTQQTTERPMGPDQSEPEETEEDEEEMPSEPEQPLEPFSKQHSVALEEKRQKDILARSMVWVENIEETELLDKNHFPEDDDDDEEPAPMTKQHTTNIEIKRQKNILSRPSVFDKTKPTNGHGPNNLKQMRTTTTATTTKSMPHSTQPKVVKKDRPADLKVVTKLTANKVSSTRSRFEPKSPKSPERRPSGPLARPLKQKPLKESQKLEKLDTTETDTHTTKINSKPIPQEPLTEEPVRDVDSEITDTESEETTTITTRQSTTKSRNYVSSIDEEESQLTHKRTNTPSKPNSSSPFLVEHNSHSPINKITTTTKLTQRTIDSKAPTSTTTKQTDTETFDTILEKPKQSKPTTPQPKRISSVTTQSVAARRNIFESGSSTTGPKTTPSKSPGRTLPEGRRPSYMDHTKCSLEHIRRDSLELNKQNYTRKPSIDEEDDAHAPRNPNSAVKFIEPQRVRKEPSMSEEIDVEEIWELEILEKLLETVTSYELRRRIRAQIRLVKKQLLSGELRETKTTKEFKTFSTHEKKTTAQSLLKSEEEEEVDSQQEQQHFTRKPVGEPCDEIEEHRASPSKPRDRSHSPTAKTISSSLKEVRRTSDTHTATTTTESINKRFNQREEHEYSSEVRHSPVMERKQQTDNKRDDLRQSPVMNRKQTTERTTSTRGRSPTTTTPRRTSASPTHKSPTATQSRERSRSPLQKSKQQQQQQKQQQSTFVSTKTSTTRTTAKSPERRGSSKPKADTPIWADRNAILKKQGSTTPTPVRAATKTQTQKTTTMSAQRRQQQKTMENEDCITSSYGIGPTDENGLPLFGIRALKKKTQQQQQEKQQQLAAPTCETTEEVSGYVVEEKFYSDGKSEPVKERKEYIYSTNADELETLKKQVETRKLKNKSNDEHIVREYKKVDKEFLQQEPKALLENEEFITSSTKNVRRGSVKEMSEKFIRKESSQSITEKSSSSSYPKAGLILRTSSRINGTDAADAMHADDFSDVEDEHIDLQRSSCLVSASESESESVSIRREISESKSSMSSSTHRAQSTRSFTNTSGESRIVTGMDDVLERMRNADKVVETGDSQEDQEARALLNKFLGASVIMHGVGGGVVPKNESTTTTTRKFINQEGDNIRQQEVKTTRVTKTIKSGSSSSPVTASTTCDIEEIWDEDLLKELLEQAKTYEERRQIRARLRELMAEREEKKSTTAAAAVNAEEEDESSASEYEEIIEEVTDYSDSDEEEAVTAKEQTPDVSSPEPPKATKTASNTKTATTTATTQKAATATTKQTETAKKTTTTTTTAVATSKQTKVTKASEVKSSVTAKVEEVDTASDQADSSKVVAQGESLEPSLPLDSSSKNSQAIKPQAKQTKAKQTSHSSSIASNTSNDTTKLANKKAQTTKSKPKSVSDNRTAPIGSISGSVANSKNLRATHTVNTHTINNNNNNNSSSNTHNVSQNTEIRETEQTDETDAQIVIEDEQTVIDAQTVGDSLTKTTTKVTNMPNNNNEPKQVDRLSVPPKEDSGTESGEDLRLLAAGLRDKLHMQSDSDVIVEVTKALSRLECSLKEGKEISVEPSKRNTLLALVERLQTGLTSPEKLAEIAMATAELDMNETSSPEADAHRTSRQRFAKRRNRNNRHTVGVSREELADARRYMEDMLMMGSISSCTTPDSNTAPVTPPNWFPLEKNASSGAILTEQPTSQLYRPNQFVPNSLKSSTECLTPNNARSSNRRPLSGDFSVSFEEDTNPQQPTEYNPDSAQKQNRFNSKKQIMKRANTIDFGKAKKYSSEFDTDSELEDKGPNLGLKRAVQVTVKKKVQSVVPPFEPKTENDHKFLAFINKQSPKPGLGWNNARSVSNWTNKFGNLKHTFEVGEAATSTKGKPPQPPGRAPVNAAKSYWNKQTDQTAEEQRLMRAQQERRLERERIERERMERERMERQRLEHERYERDRIERQRMEHERQRLEHERLERERMEREYFEREYLERERMERERRERELIERDRLERDRIERDRLERERVERELLERKRLERERLEKERLEREHLERERVERDRRERERIERELLAKQQQQQLKLQQQQQQAQSGPVNKFQHAPQSVFRPIENYSEPKPQIYKPIAQKQHSWQPTQQQHLPKPSSAPYISSPSPTATSPIGLPWASKPTIDNSIFRSRAHRFEERAREDERNPSTQVQRHSSLRGAREQQQQQQPRYQDFNKRPSLPNAADPYMALHSPYTPPTMQYKKQPQHYASATYLATTQSQPQQPPPPTNISFSYADLKPRSNYLSQPCLPTAVMQDSLSHLRSREDSLTNPQAMPLVLTSANPSYDPLIEPLDTNYEPMSEPAHTYMQVPQKRFDYASPLDSGATSPSFMTAAQTDLTDDDVDSDNLLEYRVESKVMRRPEGQTAVTVTGRRTNHMSDDEVFGKNSRAAKNLLHTMRNLGGTENKARVSTKKQSESPKQCLSPDGRSYQAPIVEPLFPDLTTFKPSRAPIYAKNKPETQLPSVAYQKNPVYTPPASTTTPTTTAYTPPSVPYTATPKLPTQQPTPQTTSYTTASSYAPIKEPIRSAAPSSQPPRPYVTEAQTAYVVTYPADDSADERESYHHSKTTQQRSRYTSENSTSSSVSNNVPSPRTSWTTNPMHADEVAITAAWKDPTRPMEEIIRNDRLQQQQAQLKQTEKLLSRKPELAPKPQIPNAAKPNYLPNSAAVRPKLNTRSHTITGSQHPYDTTADPSVGNNTPLQKQNRVLSQQTLASPQQKYTPQQPSHEVRRSSLGYGHETQQRRSSYTETQQSTFTQTQYKSSAPADTPDIVKSSLPKDENMPILKKFGPPQRHHYMPNSYQTPSVGTNSSTSSAAHTHKTNVVTTHQQHQQRSEIVQHSTHTSKPFIVETPATPQPQSEDQIPRNIVFNNINAFAALSRRNETEDQHTRVPNRLSKSDSWNQICQSTQQTISTTTKFSAPPQSNELRRTKSGHSLTVPKLYEAGISQSELGEKQRTVAAYFSGQKSPNSMETLESRQVTTKRSAINRTKTTEKSSASRKSMSATNTFVNGASGMGGLSRSATMPHIANVNLLDESNVEDAFEQLMLAHKQQSATATTTEKTETKAKDGAVVTTTTKVTTRTVTGNAQANKTASPFAKFKQLDKQNSNPKSPTTPTTPGSGGGGTATASPSGNAPIFKFTDPALNARAATVKEQLLQWCQMKTQEYENVQITNFSTSWSDGLAFCALIHHFLPDAFDYSKLTPQTRKHNFELAFTVADEKAGIAPLLDVEDMVVMKRPDWKCVFVYVQSIYCRFRNCQ